MNWWLDPPNNSLTIQSLTLGVRVVMGFKWLAMAAKAKFS